MENLEKLDVKLGRTGGKLGKVFFSGTFSSLTAPTFKSLNELTCFYGSVNLLEI